MVYEAGPRFGGVLVTEQVDDFLVEAGPDSFLTEKPWAADLCRRIGLEDQLIGSNDDERKTYILVKGKLAPLPDGLMFMVPTQIAPALLSPLFSAGTKLRMLREWRFSPRQSNGDESVASLVERHYGAEMVDRLADPLLSGVYGGTADELSVRAVLPRFAEMEAKHGSLARGMLAARKLLKQSETGPRPIFTSLQKRNAAVAGGHSGEACAQTLCTQTRSYKLSNGKTGVGSCPPDTPLISLMPVIVATPSPAAATLLEISSPDLSALLRTIPYSSSVTVALGFGEDVRASLPPGFGFLVPRSEGKRMLATTFRAQQISASCS